jgi:uncharacterized membrane protein
MASRNECEGKYGDELNACLARINELQAKLGDLSESERTELIAKLDELREKREDVWEKYEKMRRSREDEWQSHEGEIKNALLFLQDALDKSYARWHK